MYKTHIAWITHIIYITHIFYRTQITYITHPTYIYHILKLSLKLIKNIFDNYFFLYIKMKNNYYQKHKEKLWKEAHETYENLTEEKEKKCQYHQECNRNIFWGTKAKPS